MWLIIALRSALPLRLCIQPGCWRVPGQGVTADLHAVAGGPVVDLVAGGEVELVLVRLGRVGLHLVLGRDHVELTRGDRGVRRVAQPARGDRGTEVAARLRRRRAQRRGGRAGVGSHDPGTDQDQRTRHGGQHQPVPATSWSSVS